MHILLFGNGMNGLVGLWFGCIPASFFGDGWERLLLPEHCIACRSQSVICYKVAYKM
jgi:hypothetical protein